MRRGGPRSLWAWAVAALTAAVFARSLTASFLGLDDPVHILRNEFKIAMALVTYFLVNITWVFFRAQSFGEASTYLASMFAIAPAPKKVLYLNEIVPAAIAIAGMVVTHWRMRDTSMEAVVAKTPAWLIGATLTFMLFMLVISQGSDSAFIYFQF